MCANYWNLETTIKCPNCKKGSTWELQTHFMGGETGTMCVDRYKINDLVPPLRNMTITLDGKNDDFIGGCKHCKKYFDYGATIENGRVTGVFPIK